MKKASWLLAACIGFLGASLSVADVQPAEMAVKADQTATVHVFRSAEVIGSRSVKLKLRVNDESLNRLGYRDHVTLQLPAGKHVIGGVLAGTQALEIEVQPGNVYYVGAEMQRDGATTSARFVAVDATVAQAKLSSMGYEDLAI